MFGAYFALIVIPVLIIGTSVVIYLISGKKQENKGG